MAPSTALSRTAQPQPPGMRLHLSGAAREHVAWLTKAQPCSRPGVSNSAACVPEWAFCKAAHGSATFLVAAAECLVVR